MLMDNEKVQSYLNSVCSEIRLRESHQEIKLELMSHIQEMVADYLAQGFNMDEAVEKAIAHMGNSSIVGKELAKVHKPKPEWSIILLSLLFVSLGLLLMHIMDSQGLSGFSLFARSLSYTVLGAIIIVGLYFFDYRKLEAYSKNIYMGSIMLLVLTLIANPIINGKRWLSIGGISIDIVSISPFLFVIALAGILNNIDWRDNKKFIHGILLSLMPLVLLVANGSFFPAALIYIIACITVLTASGAGYRVSIFMMSLMMTVIALPLLNSPYKLQSLLAFINPHGDPLGSGYLYMQLSNLIKSAGLYGQGFVLEKGVMPELHTDFIFAYIIFTFGWIAAFVIAAMAAAFLVRMAHVATVVKNSYGKLLIRGFVAVFSIEFIWYIFMNLGFAPIAGVGLPFISYGGSQLIVNALAVGAILSIYRRRSLSKILH
ncbi:FtsW/RodA/SpoVE family cell cycle protein [Desulfitibacter alkalitolerans]|uniref:FtsW/RodA/SpoVE family cell cycle protein n=1 Tax=Desulfitibacter alkalitolerans TaxID=264641 RepID=UPI000487A205|nr:FtsW/RodA/SpoVE family cell cycle protein [Desulfitibacter alkalitolerans]